MAGEEKERSRMVRYADLRRKIENMTYFSLDEESKSVPTPDYRPDPDADGKKDTVGSVRHNTLTVPLDQLLRENSFENTMELKAIDVSDPSKRQPVFKGRQIGSKKFTLPKDWWIWLLVVISALIVCAVIVTLAIIFAPKA